MSLANATPEEETANLQAIAAELAQKPELVHWAETNADIGGHVGQIHKLYPWLSPGVTLALGTARYTADDPFVKQLADATMAYGRKASTIGGPLGGSLQAEMSRGLDQQVLGTTIPGVSTADHKTWFDTAVGAVGHEAHTLMSEAGSFIPGTGRDAVKSASRWTMGGLQSGLEAVQGSYRMLQADTSGKVGQVAEDNPSVIDRLTGKNVGFDSNQGLLPQLTIVQQINGKNAGSGFFPGGQAATDARAAQFRAANEGGHALTIGRGVAGSVLPANSTAYHLVSGLGDAAVSLYGDPSQMALGAVGDLRAAQRGVAAPGTDWGWADTLRQKIGIRTASEQLDSKVGQGIIQKLADLTDVRSVHHFLGEKLDPSISSALAHATTPDEVRALLDHELGTGIETLPSFHPRLQGLGGTPTDEFGNPLDKGLGSLGYAVDRTTRNWRPLAMLPGGSFPTDLSQSWTRREAFSQLEAHMENAKVAGPEISHALDMVARASNRNEMYAAFDTAMDIEADTLSRKFGIAKSEARRMTRAWTTGAEMNETSSYFMRAVEDKFVVPGMSVDGEPMLFNGPHLPTEHLNSSIPLPDFREIRRAASSYRQFLRATTGGTAILKGADITTDALDAFMHVWKGAQLLRPALLVRILGESQLSMAAAGDASAFRHPIDYIAYRIGHKGAFDITEGEHLFEPGDYNHVFKGGSHQVLGFDADRMSASQSTQLVRGQPGHLPAWAQEIRHAHIDPLMRATAAAMTGTAETGARTVDELKDAFFDGHLRSIRTGMMENGDTWRDPKILGRRSVSDAYIDMTVERVRHLAREDPEIMRAIATNDFRGEPLAHMQGGTQLIGRSKWARPPKSLNDRLAELADEGNAPALVKGNLYGKTKIGPGASIAGLRDHAMNRMFNVLVGERIENLAASPVFRQEYFKEVDKLLPYMDPGEAAKVTERAAKAGIDGLDASKAVGSLDAQAVDTIAKSRSLDRMAAILHDLGHRSQASDILRFVAPFGDAWKKVLTRWVKMVGENPTTIERFRQGMHEATQSGFAHTDPQSGKLVFTIPFSAGIDKAITGLPFPQTAPLNGLSIVGSGLPGVGPAVSVPLGLLAPHVPVVQNVMKTLVPFGPPNTKQGLLEAFLPGWANRLRTAGVLGPIGPSPDEQSVFNHSVDQVLRYGVSTGKYDLSTTQGISAAVADARHKATLLYVVRGALQAVSPAAPSVEYMAKDKSGRLTATYQLTNELQNLYAGKGVDGKSKSDPDQAVQIFLKLHGESNYLSLQAFSTPRRYGLPVTQGAADWLAAHKDFAKQYPNVYGLLTPQKGAFDYSLYVDEIHSGARVDRTSEDFLRLANSRIASMIYDTQRDKLPDDANATDKSNYLGQLREWLKVKYPGFRAQDLEVNKATIPDAIRELSKAVEDPAVRNTDAARGVVAYLADRQQVIDFEKQNGSGITSNSLSSSTDFEAQHQWLSQQATKLISQYPQFFPVWDTLLSHEITLSPNPISTEPVLQ